MSGLRSGVLKLSIGVGTVTMYILHSAISSSLAEKDNPLSGSDRCISVAYLSPSKSASRVWSLPFWSSCILSLFISNPITLYFLPNSIARGSPTYPSPMIAILSIVAAVVSLWLNMQVNKSVVVHLLFVVYVSSVDYYGFCHRLSYLAPRRHTKLFPFGKQ